jgi:hypothetical protein
MPPSDPRPAAPGFLRKCLAVARAIGVLPPAPPEAIWAPCPHCGQEANHAGRRCGHCGEVLTPQSKWDTAQAPLEPRRWRE